MRMNEDTIVCIERLANGIAESQDEGSEQVEEGKREWEAEVEKYISVSVQRENSTGGEDVGTDRP